MKIIIFEHSMSKQPWTGSKKLIKMSLNLALLYF